MNREGARTVLESVSPTETLAAMMRGVAEQLPESIAGAAIDRHLREACVEPTAASVAASAQFLMRVGFISQAETLFQTLAQCFPAMSTGAVGLAHVAMQRQNWVRALSRWSDVMAAYTNQSRGYFLTAHARVLNELGRPEEATGILDGVIRDFGNQPFGYTGLAQLAMRQGRWSEALERWDEVLARFPQHDSTVFSKIGRASVLLELARYREAEASLREVIHADRWIVWALLELMQVLVRTGRSEQALHEIEAGPFAGAAIPALMQREIEILIKLRRLDAARAVFATHLQRAVGLESIVSLFSAAPELHEGWQRTSTWIELRRRLDRLPVPIDTEDALLFDVTRARIQLALRDYAGFLNSFGRVWTRAEIGELGKHLRTVAAAIEDPRFPDCNKPKVFGIGLSRTGTTSLAAALSSLGLSTLHWQNPLTCELISDADLNLFDAFTDTPVCMAFEKYYYMFPTSKFIYTTRPVDSWLRSVARHWKRALSISEFCEFQRAVTRPDSFRYGSGWCEIHQTLYLNHADLRGACQAYDQRVRRFFRDKPKERFLVFDVFAGHGWPELCSFLGAPLPAAPFPFENRAPEPV
jgi:tetratricopeptide (TPR) repeat protein